MIVGFRYELIRKFKANFNPLIYPLICEHMSASSCVDLRISIITVDCLGPGAPYWGSADRAFIGY